MNLPNRSLAFVVLTLALLGCAGETTPSSGEGGATGATGSGTGSGGDGEGGGGEGGGEGGGYTGPCATDCSTIQTPPCLVAVCNEGGHPGPIGACVVVDSPSGTACEDGLFCTVNDTCHAGECQGGPPNDCGETDGACSAVTCNEATKTCSTAPANNGMSCTPGNLCFVNGVCSGGECAGQPKDCSFSPKSECNTMACNPATGQCDPTPDLSKNGAACSLSGDLCKIDRTCSAGECQGTTAKDCSALTVGCQNGVCDPKSGACIAEAVPPGGSCLSAADECNAGVCDASSNCMPVPIANGTACNDFDSCTTGDICSAGSCGGAPVADCQVYFETGFEGGCPAGWTLGGDWQCGTPSNVGPASAHSGNACIATGISANHSNNQAYATTVATSPPINLGQAMEPRLSFWAWIHTEGSSYDGFNLKVSTNGGTSFTQVTTVTPAYGLTVNGQPAWGGNQSGAGWQNFTADLSAFAGQQILLQFAFRSDGSGVNPGVYIDDIAVGEASAIPLAITTASPLLDAHIGLPFSQTLQRAGGSVTAVWSIVSGVNHGWLSLDPATGALTGMPTATGPGSITVRIAEPGVPLNFDEKTFDFTVGSAVYVEKFEGPCPNGWTLTGDWQCGTPASVGPSTAYSGSQCLATRIATNYSFDQEWSSTTATSPDIDLTGTTSPTVSFRMWIHTEGSTYDGANLRISTNGGASYSLLANVTPAYTLTIDGQPAWGGNQSALGWQLVQANLSAYAGQVVRLRFGFRSDYLLNYSGVYIDDVLVSDN